MVPCSRYLVITTCMISTMWPPYTNISYYTITAEAGWGSVQIFPCARYLPVSTVDSSVMVNTVDWNGTILTTFSKSICNTRERGRQAGEGRRGGADSISSVTVSLQDLAPFEHNIFATFLHLSLSLLQFFPYLCFLSQGCVLDYLLPLLKFLSVISVSVGPVTLCFPHIVISMRDLLLIVFIPGEISLPKFRNRLKECHQAVWG